MITLREYDAAVTKAQSEYPEWRYGQTLFNVLYEHEPELADEIRATELDPFYVDTVIPQFVYWLTGKLPE